ncbi:hypothetical protein VP01_1042g7 [Puccinia sorghi]|uniref:Uncharacterized protein n=1 Tax=Puccinia sorghi TaxID=27349 RepID=A0A0L6VUK7_9BASI|nr:hypothetical protein VP01_1042g7 [Puccinia sorghi]
MNLNFYLHIHRNSMDFYCMAWLSMWNFQIAKYLIVFIIQVFRALTQDSNSYVGIYKDFQTIKKQCFLESELKNYIFFPLCFSLYEFESTITTCTPGLLPWHLHASASL